MILILVESCNLQTNILVDRVFFLELDRDFMLISILHLEKMMFVWRSMGLTNHNQETVLEYN
jgi:hypothetical protein